MGTQLVKELLQNNNKAMVALKNNNDELVKTFFKQEIVSRRVLEMSVQDGETNLIKDDEGNFVEVERIYQDGDVLYVCGKTEDKEPYEVEFGALPNDAKVSLFFMYTE